MKSTMIQQNLPTPVLSIDMKLKRTLIASAIAGLSLFSLTSHAMEKADLMITDAMVLTMNQDKTVYESGTVVVKDNKIIAVGDASLEKQYKAEQVLDVDGDIVMPGLINTHTHVSMTVFRSLADDVPDRLHRYIFPLEKKLVSRDMVRIGANLGNVEMVKGGVTTYADMYYFEDEVAKTVDKIGMRAVLGETVIKFPVVDAKEPYGGIEYAKGFIEQYKNDELITPAYAPHAVYTVSKDKLQEINKLSAQYDVPVLIHVAEFPNEEKRIKDETKATSPAIRQLTTVRVAAPGPACGCRYGLAWPCRAEIQRMPFCSSASAAPPGFSSANSIRLSGRIAVSMIACMSGKLGSMYKRPVTTSPRRQCFS